MMAITGHSLGLRSTTANSRPNAVVRSSAVPVRATLLNRPPSKHQQPNQQQAEQSQQQQSKQVLKQSSDAAVKQQGVRPPVNKPEEVVAMILGGGPGTDLWPLTHTRAEPAVPFAGLFRLIDVPVSNCIHSGISNIYVLTQYNATSLNRHLSRAYQFLNGITFQGHGHGFVESLSASQCPGRENESAWYQGTADAIRRYVNLLNDYKHTDCEDVLILSGDQLYRMDYTKLLNYHRQRGADVTIATTPADEDHASHLGVLTVDKGLNVLEFHEKPPRKVLATMSIDTLEYGFAESEAEALDKPFVASMGMYVFKKDVLQELLLKRFPKAVDFSRDILSLMHGELNIAAYPFHGYWEDVGSLKDYYAANMAMAADTSRLRLFDRDQPLYSEARVLPPSKVAKEVIMTDSLLGDGCRVMEGSVVKNSVLGSCAYIDQHCFIQDTIIFGADNLDSSAARQAELAAGTIPLGVGEGSKLVKAIIDSNARIGKNCSLTNKAGVQDGSNNSSLPSGVVIKDGIVVVMRGAVLPDGTAV